MVYLSKDFALGVMDFKNNLSNSSRQLMNNKVVS